MKPADTSLTNGSLVRCLLVLSGPMMVSALLQNLQSLVDMYWVGWLGETAVAAIALSGTVLMLVFPIIMGASTGTVALVSRFIGTGDNRSASGTAAQSIFLVALLGIVLGATGCFFTPLICSWFSSAPAVIEQASAYLRIMFLGAIGSFVLFAAMSSLQGAGNASVPMRIMVFSNMLNLAIEPIPVFGLYGFPAIGIRGAAVATLIAQVTSAVIAVVVLMRGSSGLKLAPSMFRIQPSMAWRIMRIGVPGTGQMLSRSVMAVVIMAIVARYGTEALAGYGIGMRIHMIILLPAFVLANAVAAIVGQNLGAGKPDRAGRVAWMATGWDMAIMAVCAAVLFVWSRDIVGFFNNAPDVVRIGAQYLMTVSPFYVFVALAIVLGRAFFGAGNTVPPMICTFVGLWIVQVPLALVLPRFFCDPTMGIWWAVAIGSIVNGLSVAGWFRLGRWKTHKI